MLNIYIANLGAYNEGLLLGEWLELPATEEQITALYDRIRISHDNIRYYDECGCPYEETAIHDYESDLEGFQVGEWDSIDKLNEIAEQLEELDEMQRQAAALYVEMCGYSWEDALQKASDYEFSYYDDCHDMSDVAYVIAEESGLLESIPESLRCYFDFEAYGRDLEIEGHFEYVGNGRYFELYAA